MKSYKRSNSEPWNKGRTNNVRYNGINRNSYQNGYNKYGAMARDRPYYSNDANRYNKTRSNNTYRSNNYRRNEDRDKNEQKAQNQNRKGSNVEDGTVVRSNQANYISSIDELEREQEYGDAQ